MTDSESEANGKHSGINFHLKKQSDIEILEREELCAYISLLHELLIKKDRKFKKYKEKYKAIVKDLEDAKAKAKFDADNTTNLETDVEPANVEKQETDDNATTTVDSFVDDIRRAAEQAQNLNGFVYEPTSGLYYDQKTGYYYNAEYGLYYDGNSGCYYNYNQEKNEFEFHSQVQTQQTPKTAESHKASDKDALTNYADIDADELVAFDEFGGVITDEERLRKIKEERRQDEEAERTWRKKKKNTRSKMTKNDEKHEKSIKSKKRKHKSKKRKRTCERKSKHSSSACSESDIESMDTQKSKKRVRKLSCDFEDGELSDSSSSESESASEDSSRNSDDNSAGKDGKKVETFSGGGRFQDIAKKYPPSLRVIVQESNLESLKVGSLSLITYKGGSLGREGKHDVIIPDVNVSKLHMKFYYDHKKSIYKCIDLGSRNGTVLNGTRMSASKQESSECDLVHGSVLQIGQTKLLCHVHEGNSTCGLCEPGLLIEASRENSASMGTTTVLTHREQLKKLQKKYGLEKEKFVEAKQSTSSYNDRAATRRTQVGSSTDGEKTQTASVNTEISAENKGFKMLSKLGWNKGEALGKVNDGSGLLEPINVSSNEGKKGLGCEGGNSTGVTLTSADKRKIATWQKTQARYQQTDIFGESDDSS
ncbi:angiogenic factor with G patch and FHA domains 1 isoform X1 [Ceratitis capitata]|uniref:angiogenic factor with G patch and FHA domains 1 isoform X1 n=1 Tax=Ceratitis capitata TaxID=7213 RepID=UPI00061886E5|nr:angiogenic factor with G patch and FHA domains 1 isoform X1 [Ceratitis capitata]